MQPIFISEDVRRANKRLIDIAVGACETGDQVVRGAAMDPRRILSQRSATVGCSCQQFELDFHQGCGVFRNIRVCGDGYRNGFADINGFKIREYQAVALLPVGSVGQRHYQPISRHRRSDILGREDSDDTGQR